MPRTRKLFPSYGSALATHLLSSIEREHLVAGFVATYVSAYKRPGILGGPVRDRELAETIGREIVLASLHTVSLSLLRYMGKKNTATFNAEEKKIVDAFFAETHATLGRIWRWSPEDTRQFQRDLSLYSEAAVGKSDKRKPARARSLEDRESPFVGRVAVLLDPSMIEQARRATTKFHAEIEKFAQNLLKQTLNPSGS